MSYGVKLPERGTFEAWRAAARVAISHRIPPDQIDWTGGGGLFAAAALPDVPGPHQAKVPEAFVKLAGSVIWHSAPERLSLLYQALWRLDRRCGDPLSQADALGRKLQLLAKSVGRDIHKMHAFVRFRECPADGPRRRFAAWFEPEHNTLEPGSRFFAKRFADMDWLIATPRLTAHFQDGTLSFGPAGARPDLSEDASETLWATYFANIFNPARVKLAAMRSEMPKKYWKNLPETRLIPAMLKDAEVRVQRMREAGSSAARPGAVAISSRYRNSMLQAPDLRETPEDDHTAAAAASAARDQPGDRADLANQTLAVPKGGVG